MDNETRVFFVQTRGLPSWPDGDVITPKFRLWRSWLRHLPARCTWLMKVPASSYLNLAFIRHRLGCLTKDPSLQYLGVGQAIWDERNRGAPPLVADPSAGVVLHRSLLERLPALLEACVAETWFRNAASLGEAALGVCLLHHKVELATWLQEHDEAIFNQQVNVAPDNNPFWSRSFSRVSAAFDSLKLSRLRCLVIASGLRPKELFELHAMRGKSLRWFKGISCCPGGLSYPELMTMDVGQGPKRPIFDSRVRQALQDCFLSRAFHQLQTSARDSRRLLQLPVASSAELAEEWRKPARGRGAAFDMLSRGGHDVCVFVLTAGAGSKHRAHARAAFETWASQKPAGVEVFFVKDFSWTEEELTGKPRTEEDPPFLFSLRGDVDLGFLYNPVRAFYLWLYLAAHHASDCGWFVKVDGDTLVNLWALKLRLQRYFKSSDSHYLGSVKSSQLMSGQSLKFAVNSIVLSSGLLLRARTWFQNYFGDLIYRRLGEGAEDMDMAMCLKQHASIFVQALGGSQELSSTALLKVKSGGDGSSLLKLAKICTLIVHPIYPQEMTEVYSELARLIADNATSTTPELCNWPEEPGKVNSKDWNQYMASTFHKGEHNCWDGRFTWKLCCHPSFGPAGNVDCWDDENTWERCCNRPQTARRPEPAQAVQAPSPPSPCKLTRVTNPEAASASAPRITAVSGSFTQSASSGPGNPKCWSEGFTFELCCVASNSECWTWPFSHGFCCETPLPPRLPLQVGGMPGASSDLSAKTGQRPRTSRCPHSESTEDAQLLACHLSLDEIGALFELPAIGSGDKASGWHDYLGNYERLLLNLPLSASVLEFGVRMGSSLAMWSEYFPHGIVVGMDKNLMTFNTRGKPVLTAHGAFARGNVYVLQANASDLSGRHALEELGFQDGFDVIVDDANHWAKDQLARFELYFPTVLRPGGVYLIEDVHIQAPHTADGDAVRSYLANLSAGAYISPEILLGSHHIRAARKSAQDWRHKVEWVTFLRDMVAIGKSEDAS